jgi:hypothetical protein
MTVAGNFQDEDLVVGSNHYIVRQQYRPGDKVVMSSHLLMYGIGPFTGQCRGLVLCTHREVTDWYNTQKKKKKGRRIKVKSVTNMHDYL